MTAAPEPPAAAASEPAIAAPVVPEALRGAWETLAARAAAFPDPVREMAVAGLRKVVDFQDLGYGAEYLDRLEALVAEDDARREFGFSLQAAKYLANAMVYDDIVRVADLKTRARRTARVAREMALRADQTLRTLEYFHPRMAEIGGLLPARLGRAVAGRPGLMRRLDRVVDRGRRVRTDGILGFSALWLVAGLRRWRRGMYRHGVETAHLHAWLTEARARRDLDYALGVEVLKCRRLIKGYSDTHARGHAKFDRVLAALPLLAGRADAADWLRRLREAALRDAEGRALDGAIRTVQSFVRGGDASCAGSDASV